MADVKWIKIVTNIFDNRKVKQIETMPEGDTILVIWFKLICLAGSINDNGMIYLTAEIPYTEDMLAAQFGRPLAVVRLALRTFESFGMIEVVDNFLCLPSWEKYQSAEKLAHMRSKNAERQARFRERKKAEMLGKSVTHALPVTPSNAIDIDKEEDIEEEGEKDTIVSPEAETNTTPSPSTTPPAEKGKKERKKAVIVQPAADYSDTGFSEPMIAEIEKWLKYKTERREAYQPTGLQSLITQIKNNVKKHGEDAVIALISECMAANYKGIIFEKLEKAAKAQPYQGGGYRNAPPSGVDRLLEKIERGDFDE